MGYVYHMNLPNSITATRFALAAAGTVALLVEQLPYHYTVAFVCFAVAAFSDWLDGMLARRMELTTQLGTFLDPLADKLLVILYFVSLQSMGLYPLWLLLAVLARDLLNDAYRNFAASQRIIIGANAASKTKTALQMLSLLLAQLIVIARYEWPGVLPMAEADLQMISYGLMLAALVVGVIGTLQFVGRYSAIITNNE